LLDVTQVAAIILAAGASTRLGRCKQLLDWKGKPLLAHVADIALGAGLDPVIAVLGCHAQQIYPALGNRPLQALTNWRWQDGMSTSVLTGLSAVPPETDAVLILQGDQPLISAQLLRALVQRFVETGASIVYPTHEGQRGTPVLFARRLFNDLAAVTGDEGGRSLIARHSDDVATVPVSSAEELADLDTLADYRRIQAVTHPTQPEACLRDIRHLIVDMDGVLWRGDEPMPGLQPFFGFLQQHDIAFVLATNNSSGTPDQYVAKLAQFGVQVPQDAVLTSALVAAAYLADITRAGARVYVIGEDGVRQALDERGFVLDDGGDGRLPDVDYVVVGWDRGLNWRKLATASLLIHRGAGFVGTNPDTSYPTEEGPVPGNGALLAALETATGIQPSVTGKPGSWMFREALRRLDATPETSAMIGDRLDTDITGGVHAGLTTVLTLSGIATQQDLADAPIQPDLVVADIGDLTARWMELIE
jgi:4-nitrophenyl phosphatase